MPEALPPVPLKPLAQQPVASSLPRPTLISCSSSACQSFPWIHHRRRYTLPTAYPPPPHNITASCVRVYTTGLQPSLHLRNPSCCAFRPKDRRAARRSRAIRGQAAGTTIERQSSRAPTPGFVLRPASALVLSFHVRHLSLSAYCASADSVQGSP